MGDMLKSLLGEGVIKYLRQVPFLHDLSDKQLQILSNLCHYNVVDKGQNIFKEGDEGDELYIISQGRVKLFATNVEGKETNFGTLGPGGYFGEVALMINIPRTATCKVIDRVLLLAIHKTDFDNFLAIEGDLKVIFEKVAKERTANHFKKFKVPFFTSIPPQMFHKLASFCEIEHFAPSQVIFSQGSVGNRFYLIAFGTLDVLYDMNGNGESVKVMTLVPGQYFGEAALVDDSPRPATIVANTRTVLMSITKENFEKFYVDIPEAYAEFCIKLRRDKVPLSAVLNYPNGLKYFKQHLKAEFSSENVAFWKDGKKYRTIVNEDKRTEFGREIFRNYVDQNAPYQVNLDSKIRDDIVANAKADKFSPQLFDAAVNEVYKLMSRDSFSRFTQSELFARLLSEVGSYSVLVSRDSISVDPSSNELKMQTL